MDMCYTIVIRLYSTTSEIIKDLGCLENLSGFSDSFFCSQADVTPYCVTVGLLVFSGNRA
jgi:hypothetical protein